MADPRSEPSMEDILASIKRIIADDQALPLDRAPSPPTLPARREQPSPSSWPEPAAARSEYRQPPRLEQVPPSAPSSFDRPPPWPPRIDTPQPPESILELTNFAPEAMQPPRVPPASRVAPPPPAPAPPPVEPPAPWMPEPPVQRAADRQRQPDISWSVPEEPAPRPAPPPPPEPPRPAPPPIAEMQPSPALRDIGQTIVNRASGGDNTLEGLVRDMLRPMLRDWIDTHAPAMVQRIVQEEIRKMIEREAGLE